MLHRTALCFGEKDIQLFMLITECWLGRAVWHLSCCEYMHTWKIPVQISDARYSYTVFPRIEAPGLCSGPRPVFEARPVFKARPLLAHSHYDKLMTNIMCFSQKQ